VPQALSVASEQVHFKFNVAFVQIQLATTIYGLNETQRSLAQLQDAASGLEKAVAALDEIAAHPQPPYPKSDIEQRANMARNTLRKQLERAMTSQKEYEEKNKEKLAAAMELRQAQLRHREEERQMALDQERERQAKIRREREEIAAEDHKRTVARVAEREEKLLGLELSGDSETGEKAKRKRKAPAKPSGENKVKGRPRKKKAGSDGEESEAEPLPRKKRRLTNRKANAKYKSAEIVVDSSDDEEMGYGSAGSQRRGDTPVSPVGTPGDDESEQMDVDNRGDGDDEGVNNRRPQTKRSRRGRILDESEEDDDADAGEGDAAGRAEGDTQMAGGDEDDE